MMESRQVVCERAVRKGNIVSSLKGVKSMVNSTVDDAEDDDGGMLSVLLASKFEI